MDFQSIAIYFNLVFSLVVLLFIIWDHLKDDRILTTQVQEFYEDIETLIYTHIQIKYYDALESSEKLIENKELSFLKKNKNRDIIQNSYLKTKINQNFKYNSQYLGLTFNQEKLSFLNGTAYILNDQGALLKRNFDDNTEANIISNYTEINEKQISEILTYLKSLRFYWTNKYKKSVFRPDLKQRINFHELLGYVKPLKPLEQKRRSWRKILFRKNTSSKI